MGRPLGPPTTNIGIRIPDELLARIDQAAEHNGQTRTAYILSWLPENYDTTAETATNGDTNNAR